MLLKLWSATERKLAMAKYYLQRMRDTQNNPYAFDFECELESFLAHAGSITNLPRPRADEDNWFMEKEYGYKPGFKEWYEEKRFQLQSDEIMRFLRGERNIVVHFNKQIIHAISTTKVSFVERLSVSSSFQSVVTNVDNGSENMVEFSSEIVQPALPTEHTSERMWEFKTDDLTGSKEIITVCEKYLETLNRLVEECHSKGF